MLKYSFRDTNLLQKKKNRIINNNRKEDWTKSNKHILLGFGKKFYIIPLLDTWRQELVNKSDK